MAERARPRRAEVRGLLREVVAQVEHPREAAAALPARALRQRPEVQVQRAAPSDPRQPEAEGARAGAEQVLPGEASELARAGAEQVLPGEASELASRGAEQVLPAREDAAAQPEAEKVQRRVVAERAQPPEGRQAQAPVRRRDGAVAS
jgi:hypothetical protein